MMSFRSTWGFDDTGSKLDEENSEKLSFKDAVLIRFLRIGIARKENIVQCSSLLTYF